MSIFSDQFPTREYPGEEMVVSEGGLCISVVDTLEALDRIEHEYTTLFHRGRAGFYVSFDFIRTCWEQFSDHSDRLLVLTIRRSSRLVGIAPFVIENETFPRRLPLKVIKFITEWGVGDRPGILTTEDEAITWQAICHFLRHDFRSWDVLQLSEQPLSSPTLTNGCFSEKRYPRHRASGGVSLRASLSGSWSGFLSTRKSKVRSHLARSNRRLAELPLPASVICVDNTEDIEAAFDEYVKLEKGTWKRDSPLSIAGNSDLERFNRALVKRLAPKGMVAIYFLRCGTADAAAALIFRAGDRIYGAHICYAPEFASFSPGIVLNAEIMKRHFDSQYRVFDLLTLADDEASRRFKENWATEREELVLVTIFNPNARHLAYRLERRIFRFWRLLKRWRRAT